MYVCGYVNEILVNHLNKSMASLVMSFFIIYVRVHAEQVIAWLSGQAVGMWKWGVRIGECFGAEGCGNVQQVQDRGLFGSRGYVVMGLCCGG